MALATDKNQGPAIMYRGAYSKDLPNERLLEGNEYQQPDEFLNDTQELFCEFESDVLHNKIQFFERGFEEPDGMPQFYAKIHETENSGSVIPFRPVTSRCGSHSAPISRCLNNYLRKLVKLVPSHTPNSRAVLKKTQETSHRRGLFTFYELLPSQLASTAPGSPKHFSVLNRLPLISSLSCSSHFWSLSSQNRFLLGHGVFRITVVSFVQTRP